jgi:protein-disulfide isomerase
MPAIPSSLLNRLTSKRGLALALAAVLVLGAAVGLWRQQLAAVAADGKKPLILAQADGAAPANSASGAFSAEQKAAIEKIIKDYLIANPELMMEIQNALEAKMETLQAERLKVALKESAAEVFRRPNAPVAGNPSGDITVVEFFDYNCGYCKRAFSDIAKLVEKDPKIRLVLKELPILSKGSEEAAKLALAARLQGKYWEMHRALLSMRGEVNEQTALKAAEKLGLDTARLKKDMEAPEVKAEIEAVRNLAQKLGIQGTPHFLVGDKPIPGAPQNLLEVISGHVAELRKSGCTVC